jgi:hypothetical protein
MKRTFVSVIFLVLCNHFVLAQKYFTKNGHISFFSKATLEDIKADNNQVVSVLNAQSGDLQFSVLIKSFHFPKAMMQEHFNENYLESDKYPKSTFKGTITDISAVNFSKDGSYSVNVNGDLTIHGITKKADSKGTIIIEGAKITGRSVFNILLADYKISIPKLVENNISKTIQITVDCLYDQKM